MKSLLSSIVQSVLSGLSFQPSGLSVHIFDHYIINLAEGGAIFKNFPRFVCVKVDFDKLFISDSQQTVAFEMFCKVIADYIFIKVFTFDQKLT